MGQPESGAARVRHRPDSAQLLWQCGDCEQRPHPGHHLLLPRGTPLRRGTTGPSVVVVQVELNRISQNYPAIPKIPLVDGIFGAQTEAAVRKFQEIVNLAVDGVVGRETWYALVRYYVAVTSLAELRSQGQRFYTISWAISDP